MIMSNLTQQLDVFSKALTLRSERHQVLASNIANADTPQYKARDFDFARAMQNAVAGRTGGLGLTRTTAGHLDSNAGGIASANMQFRSVTQGAVDGNTVDMDVERAAIGENSLQYEVLTRLVTDRLQSMRAAIAGNQ